MADITDPEAVRFSNEKVRVAADRLARAYYFGKEVVSEWYAVSMASKIPNTTDVIIDGSAVDGRTTITGADVTNLITRLTELITEYEADSNAKLNTVLKPEVNGDNY